MSRILKKKSNNSGNTFVVIMVSIACMSILVAVILASIGYYYRMCKMNLNDKNNFYYLEKAMDEIYTGIGNDSVDHLMTAYSDTVEVMVRYDATKGEYVTINESEANSIMKQKFLNEIANDNNYKNQENQQPQDNEVCDERIACQLYWFYLHIPIHIGCQQR